MEFFELPYPEPKSVIEMVSNYQHIINLCQLRIAELLPPQPFLCTEEGPIGETSRCNCPSGEPGELGKVGEDPSPKLSTARGPENAIFVKRPPVL